jgi:hypothetical protein
VLGTFTEDGTSTGDADGSAIFLGVKSDERNIAKLEFSLVGDSQNPLDFAINTVSMKPTPEPSTLALGGVGAAGSALYGWRRRRRVRA